MKWIQLIVCLACAGLILLGSCSSSLSPEPHGDRPLLLDAEATVSLIYQQPRSRPARHQPGFQIDFNVVTGLTEIQGSLFSAAAQRWSEVIGGDVRDVVIPGVGRVDDLYIDVIVAELDGLGGTLGGAAPIRARLNLIPSRGVMILDQADINRQENQGKLTDLVLHEIGHILGIGTLWLPKQFLQNPLTDNPIYTGFFGVTSYRDLVGGSTRIPVPVENTGGFGTKNFHWRESEFNTELMTGFQDNGTEPLSLLTIAALRDLGYQVNPNAADPFNLEDAHYREESGEARDFILPLPLTISD